MTQTPNQKEEGVTRGTFKDGIVAVTIKCESNLDAEKAAVFINGWQKFIRASWCGNELALSYGIRRRIPYPDFDEEEDAQSSEQKEAEG